MIPFSRDDFHPEMVAIPVYRYGNGMAIVVCNDRITAVTEMVNRNGYIPKGRIPAGATLPTNLGPGPIHTRQPTPPFTGDSNREIASYIAAGFAALTAEQEKLARAIENRSRVFDQYQPQGVTSDAETSITLQPSYDLTPEKVEAVIITGPATQPSTSTPAVNQIPLAATGVASYNNNSVGVLQTITGGTVTAIAINGTTTGLTTGVFFVPAGGTVTVTYSVAPTTFSTAGVPVTTQVPTIVTLQLGDRIWTLNMPPAGVLVIAPVAILLGRTDQRVVTGPAGHYNLELMGIADERFNA